jgi:hypothetical protein
MARRRRLGRVVVDTSVVIRAARAFRQQPPKPKTPELRLVLTWRDDPEVFTWLYSQEILTEYREILSRLKVPRNAAGRFINLLGQCGEEVTEPATGEYSPDPKDDPFYHCALGGDMATTIPRIQFTSLTRVNKRASGRSGMDAKSCFHSHNSAIYSSAQSCARLGGGRCQSPVLSSRLWPKISSNCHACAKQ